MKRVCTVEFPFIFDVYLSISLHLRVELLN